jgi:hypothetical protein
MKRTRDRETGEERQREEERRGRRALERVEDKPKNIPRPEP